MAGLPRLERFELPEPVRRFFEGEWDPSSIRVEEYHEGETMVVKAELPGVDPEKDVEVSVNNGVLNIRAKRQEKSEQKDKNGYRSEFRYGSFTRNITLPPGCRQEEVRATYSDGVLEVRIPVHEQPVPGGTKIPISRGQAGGTSGTTAGGTGGTTGTTGTTTGGTTGTTGGTTTGGTTGTTGTDSGIGGAGI